MYFLINFLFVGFSLPSLLEKKKIESWGQIFWHVFGSEESRCTGGKIFFMTIMCKMKQHHNTMRKVKMEGKASGQDNSRHLAGVKETSVMTLRVININNYLQKYSLSCFGTLECAQFLQSLLLRYSSILLLYFFKKYLN